MIANVGAARLLIRDLRLRVFQGRSHSGFTRGALSSNRRIRIALAGPTGFHAGTIVGGHPRKNEERYMGGHDTNNQHDHEALHVKTIQQ